MAEDNDKPTWRPLSVREAGGEAAVRYDALYEGVPLWLEQSLKVWVGAQLRSGGDWSVTSLRKLEREMRMPLRWDKNPARYLLDSLEQNDDLFLDVVDYLLRDLYSSPYEASTSAIELAEMLQEAGSAWEVASRPTGGFGLQRRVLKGVAASGTDAFQVEGAGDHLRKAWFAAYGRHPQPSTAYSEAVKAVEAAARAVVTPKDTKATLGKMVSALRDAPQKWDIVLAARPGFDKVQVVRAMADLLCQGQTDRHGTPNPTPVNQEQAEAALHLAVALVHWFASGSIRVRS